MRQIKNAFHRKLVLNTNNLRGGVLLYRDGKLHRLHKPSGKRYSFGKGLEYDLG